MANNPKGQGGHVVDELLDYLRGNVSPGRREEIRAHLEVCEECAEDFSFGEQFRAQIESVREAHVESDRLVELASGSGAVESPSEKFHLRVCKRCHEEQELLRALPGLEELTEPTEEDRAAARLVETAAGERAQREKRSRKPRKSNARPSPRSMRRRWMAVAVAASLVIIAVFRSGPGAPDIAFPDPIPVSTLRDVPGDGSFEHLYNEGLARYKAKEYASAAEWFARAQALDAKNGALLVYHASALLFANEYEQAAALAGDASMITPNERLSQEAIWIRAHALYRAGDSGAARELFESIASGNGTHAEAAERIVREIDDS